MRNAEYRAMVLKALQSCCGKTCLFYRYEGSKFTPITFYATIESVSEKEVQLHIKDSHRRYPLRRFLWKWEDCFGLKF